MCRNVILCLLSLVVTMPLYAEQGEGDQFLDGIGETALVARYLFGGSVEDRSRNSFDGVPVGQAAGFAEDATFGTVLSLPGGRDGGYVQIPGHALAGVESLSVTGWVNVRDVSVEQRFFELGDASGRRYLYCAPAGAERSTGSRARISVQGAGQEQGPSAFRIAAGQWVHLAVVLDAAEKTLSLYVDGVRVGRSGDIDWSLADILDRDNPEANRLSIGKSFVGEHADLGGRVYDVRFYSIALSDRQVAVIRHNAISDEKIEAVEREGVGPAETDEQDSDYLAATGLTGVPDVKVTTVAGRLPRLPYYVRGVYRDGAEGPLVRVIWPSPTDNRAAAEAGTYTVTGQVPGSGFTAKAVVTVVPEGEAARPQMNLEPFGLGQVVLNPDVQGRQTPFMTHRDKFVSGLAGSDPNSFLYMFRDAFGREQPAVARPLRGWDSQTTRLRGHASGHYLTAIAQAYAGSGYDPTLRAVFAEKMDTMIDVLYELSQLSGRPATEGGSFTAEPASVPPGEGRDGYDSDLGREGIRTDYWHWGRGYISAYPPDQFIMLEQGATYGGRNDQIWAPYYTLHKILAGLMDCYEVGGNPKALETAKGMGVWVYERLRVLETDTLIQMWNRYIAGEYGGMNEAMARLHRLTGDGRFLEGARLFDNIAFFFGDAERTHGLACNVDTIRGKHANQHIPQITGALETFRVAGQAAYYDVADHFWDMCIHSYTYSIGGVAGAKNPNNAECFTAQPDTLFANGFSPGGQNETCATYNLLKLSRLLFLFDQDAKYMDYYEQALYNHILASVAENDAGNTYHVPLNPGARKTFSNARMDSFTCCNGTAIESGTKLQDSIYLRSKDHRALYVNLFVPSSLNWPERNVTVTQRTDFPYADTTALTIGGGGRFTLHVRVPRWVGRGFFVTINGEAQAVEAVAGSYLALGRDWRDGDVVELRMPMDFYLRPVMDQPNIAGVFYGPVLLAVEESEARTEWRPITLDAADIGQSFTGDASVLRFESNGLTFKPFYAVYDRHSVYFDVSFR